MHQLIEGLDNEVTFVLFFITILLAVVIPMYVLKPRRQLSEQQPEEEELPQQENTQQTQRNSQPTTPGSSPPYIDRTVDNNVPLDNTETRPPDVDDNTGSRENSPNIDTNNTQNAENPPSANTSNAESTDDLVTIRVMLHETSQQCIVSKNMMLKDLKQKCFPTEHASGQTIRMIYSGRLLNGDTYPLRYLGIMNGSVIHAVISTQTNPPGRSDDAATVVTQDIDLSEYLLPLISMMVLGSWSFVFVYSAMFSATSITILGFLTALFLGFSFYA